MIEDSALPTVLVVDDDSAFREAMASALGRRGFAVSTAGDAREGAQLAREKVFEYALVDIRMPGPSGIELVAELRAVDDGTRVVVLTGYGTIASAVAAMRAGAVDYLTKPTDAVSVERALLGTKSAAQANEEVPSLDRVEWEYLQRVVADCQGNISDAARKLGMHRRSLQRKLSKNAPRR